MRALLRTGVAGEGVDLLHALEDGLVHFAHAGGGVAAVTLQGIGKRDGDVGALFAGQFVGRGAEVDARHGVGTIDALPHLDGIEIDLHDALLAPNGLYQEGEIGLEALAQPAAVLPQEHVAGRLLTDGAGAPLPLALLGLDLGLLDLLQIKALVLEEQVVLAGHDRLGQIVVDFLQRHPMMIDFGCFSIHNGLDTANQHQRCDIDRDILEYHHGQNGRGKEEYQYVAYPTANSLH